MELHFGLGTLLTILTVCALIGPAMIYVGRLSEKVNRHDRMIEEVLPELLNNFRRLVEELIRAVRDGGIVTVHCPMKDREDCALHKYREQKDGEDAK